MRVALFADIHGNEIALEAVLKDIATAGVDAKVCLGDLATLGPRPRAVLATLRSLDCTFILGNHDEFMLDASLAARYTSSQLILEAVEWCRAELGTDDIDFLRQGVASAQPTWGRLSAALYHGSPRSITENVLAETPAAELDKMLQGIRAELIGTGHTHIQMLRQHKGNLLVNPGSVGLPFKQFVGGGEPTILAQAEWALIDATALGDVRVDLRRLQLDRAALRAAADQSSHPLREFLVGQYG